MIPLPVSIARLCLLVGQQKIAGNRTNDGQTQPITRTPKT
jgi:hypothetical protein